MEGLFLLEGILENGQPLYSNAQNQDQLHSEARANQIGRPNSDIVVRKDIPSNSDATRGQKRPISGPSGPTQAKAQRAENRAVDVEQESMEIYSKIEVEEIGPVPPPVQVANIDDYELLDFMFTDFKSFTSVFTTKFIVAQKMDLTHFTALLNFLAGAFITMVASPVSERQNLATGYMSDMYIDNTDEYLMGTSLMFAAVDTHDENRNPKLSLFYFSDTMPEMDDNGNVYLNPESYKNLVDEVSKDYPETFFGVSDKPKVEVHIALMTGPNQIEPISGILNKCESTLEPSATHSFHKLHKTDVNAAELNNVNIQEPELRDGESLEEQFLLTMCGKLVSEFWEKFKLDRHDDATYRFFLGTLTNWAKRLRLFVDVKMEDYYSTDHATIRHVTTNFEIYPGRIMERFGVPVVTLIRHEDRKIPDYEGLGAFIRSLGPDAPYQIKTESDVYRFFDLQPKFEPGQTAYDYPNAINLDVTFTNDRKYFPGLADQLFSQRMLDCYPVDQQRVVLMEAHKALTRGATIDNFVAHFLGLLMSESEDGRSFYVILENAYISPLKVHLFLIRGWDPSAIIAISEGHVDYVRLINILIKHSTEFNLPLQFTLSTIDKTKKGNMRPTDFREAVGDHFTVSTANEWFDWSSRPDFSKFMHVAEEKIASSFQKFPIKSKAIASSTSDLHKFLVDVTNRKDAISAKKNLDAELKQGVENVFDRNAYTDDLIDSYYGSQYSVQSSEMDLANRRQLITDMSDDDNEITREIEMNADLLRDLAIRSPNSRMSIEDIGNSLDSPQGHSHYVQPHIRHRFKSMSDVSGTSDRHSLDSGYPPSKLTRSNSQTDLVGFERDKVIKKLIALRNINYNRQMDVFEKIVNVREKHHNKLPFWAFDGPLSDRERNQLSWKSVHPYLLRLPNMKQLLPDFKPSQKVFDSLTKLDHVLYMTASMAHNLIGLSGDAQIATLMCAVMSHLPDVEVKKFEKGDDPTVVGIRDTMNAESNFVLYKFEFDGKVPRKSKVEEPTKMSVDADTTANDEESTKPTTTSEIDKRHVKIFFDEKRNVRIAFCT